MKNYLYFTLINILFVLAFSCSSGYKNELRDTVFEIGDTIKIGDTSRIFFSNGLRAKDIISDGSYSKEIEYYYDSNIEGNKPRLSATYFNQKVEGPLFKIARNGDTTEYATIKEDSIAYRKIKTSRGFDVNLICFFCIKKSMAGKLIITVNNNSPLESNLFVAYIGQFADLESKKIIDTLAYFNGYGRYIDLEIDNSYINEENYIDMVLIEVNKKKGTILNNRYFPYRIRLDELSYCND